MMRFSVCFVGIVLIVLSQVGCQTFVAATENVYSEKNSLMLRDLASAIVIYAQHHYRFPESLETLYKDGKYLADESRAKSVVTGKWYVYVANGERWPVKDAGEFIVAYDEREEAGGYLCAFADGRVAAMPVKVVKEQLKERGK